MAHHIIERRTRAIARARRRVPAEALLIDALAVAYINGEDPEPLAADLFARGITKRSLRLALNALIVEYVISGSAKWPGEVRYAYDWYTKNTPKAAQ